MIQQLKENSLNITKEDILMILKKTKDTHILSLQKRLSLFEQLVQMYHQNRDFNLYEETITHFYTGGFHLGKTKLSVEKSLPKTIKIIDIVAKYEGESKETIPENHAKYLFALVKEFINTIKKLVEKKEFEGDYKRLSQQLFLLKEITLKAKNNGDIITIFDAVIRDIESANPMLLETTKNEELALVPRGEMLELTAPLYKMTKKTYVEVLKNLYLYKEDDFYKILEHALNKYDWDILREAGLSILPLYILIMKKKYTKALEWKWFSPQNMFHNQKLEDIQNLSFYPLSCRNIDDFYAEYKIFLNNLQDDQIIGEIEKEHLNYRFLKNTHTFSKHLAQVFINESEKFITSVYDRLNEKECTKLSALFNAKFTLTELDELIILDTFYGSGRDNRLQFGLNLEKGKINGVWKGKTVKVDDKHNFRRIDVPRGELTLTEFQVIEEIQSNIFSQIHSYMHDKQFNISQRMKELYSWFEEDLLELEFDIVVKEEVRALRWRTLEHKHFLARLLKRKFERELISDSELTIMMESEVMIENASFDLIDSQVVLSYLQKAIDLGLINPIVEEELVKLFTIKIKDKKAKEAFIYQVIKKYHTDIALFLSNLVEQDIESQKLTVEERRNSLVYNYYTERLANKGLKSENFLF